MSGAEMFGRAGLDVYCAVFGRNLICRSILSIHVDRKGLARYLTFVRRLDPLEAVPGVLVSFKENTVIE